jgi:tellurite resistance protein
MSNRCIGSSTAVTELNPDYLDHSDEEVMQALVTAGALVALADGRVEAVERDELLSFIDRQRLVPAISQRGIAEAFDRRVRQLEDRDSADVIVEAFRPLAGLSLASVVVRTAERVAAADRQIHPSELQALKLIRLLLMSLPAKTPTAASRAACSPSLKGNSSRRRAQNRLPDDWPVYAAFLPAVLTLAGIGITATVGSWFDGTTLWDVADANTIGGDVDDYVRGLARRGIANLPGSELRPAGAIDPDGGIGRGER